MEKAENLKAYAVIDDDGETARIVYAKFGVVARRQGADKLDSVFECVKCRRAPWADQYAPGPCPPLVMIANGWCFECSGCGVSVDADGEAWDEDEDEPRQLKPVADRYSVWCTAECQEREAAYRLERKRRHDCAVAEMIDWANVRYPGATIISGPYASPLLGEDENYTWWTVDVSLSLDFPGSVHGGAHVHLRKHTLEIFVANGDMDAWKAWNVLLDEECAR